MASGERTMAVIILSPRSFVLEMTHWGDLSRRYELSCGLHFPKSEPSQSKSFMSMANCPNCWSICHPEEGQFATDTLPKIEVSTDTPNCSEYSRCSVRGISSLAARK